MNYLFNNLLAHFQTKNSLTTLRKMSEYETQEQGDKPEVDISEVPII